jgi:hypothetical protein
MALPAALAEARDGDTIELISGVYRGAVQLERRRLTLRGAAGKAPVISGEGRVGSAKALWTVRGGEVTLEHLEFRGARSSDGGGSGVRQEGGRLTIQDCAFFDNEHGLLATNDETAELRIDRSVFAQAPRVVGGLYHLLNVGRIARLSISGSRFEQGFEGHLVKSRARENFISYNFIHDGQRGGASYELEIADGGLATVVGNIIGQGADGQNPVLLAYGTEDRAWDRNELLLAHNTFINYAWTPAWYLRVFKDHLPPTVAIHAINNLLVGPGVFWLGAPGDFEGNRHASSGMLRDIDTYGFELPPGSVWRGSGVDPRHVAGHDLSPKAEFEWPVGSRPIRGDLRSWTPGAYQR